MMMNSNQSNEGSPLNENNKSPKHRRERSIGSFRMTNNQNIITIKNQKRLMNKIIVQEDEEDDKPEGLNDNKTHFYKSLSPKPKLPNGNAQSFLPAKTTKKKTLVLDLDETLVHSSFVPYGYPADIVIKIEIEGLKYDIYVLVRPGVKEFLKKMGESFELVLFTASLSSYANPVMNIIDRERLCAYRLYREHCTLINSTFVKELRKLNRDMKEIIILDNSPLSYFCNKENGIPIESWYEDLQDKELDKMVPLLEFLSKVDDVREYIPKFIVNKELSYTKANYVMKKYDYENKANGNNRKQLDNLNSFYINAQSTPSSKPKKKKQKYYLGDNSIRSNINIKIFKPSVNIKIESKNTSNIFTNKQGPPLSVKSDYHTNHNTAKESFRSESDGDLMKYFFKETSKIKLNNTPNNTLRNNIVLNYQAMKHKIKKKNDSEGESFGFDINKYNIMSALTHTQTQNCTNHSMMPHSASTCSNSELQSYIKTNSINNGVERPSTSIRLNAFSNSYNKSPFNYSKTNSNMMTQSFTANANNGNGTSNHKKTKPNSFSSKNEWRSMVNSSRPITSKKAHNSQNKKGIEKQSQIKELRIDSNDFMIQRYKPNITSRYPLKN